MTLRGRVVVVDDDPSIRVVLSQVFEECGLQCVACGGGEEGLAEVARTPPDIVFLDLAMPGMDGLEVLRRLRDTEPELPVILVTAFGGLDSAVEAVKEGAHDYLTKPLDLAHLRLVTKRAIETRQLRRQLAATKEPEVAPDAVRLVGRHPAMVEVFKMIGAVTGPGNFSTVLVTGETGVGKQIVARVIHDNGCTRGQPFVTVHCSGVPDTLVEAELFGHEQGAFTGAVRRRTGRIESAGEGTVFLDEIGDISPAIQLKLLRLLDTGEYERLGASATQRARCRFVTATNQDLAQAIREDRFREDLYFRLRVIAINIPPLREREEDIPLLVDHFLSQASHKLGSELFLDPEALRMLVAYDFPGNVRELKHILEQAVALARGSVILPEHIKTLSPVVQVADPHPPTGEMTPLEEARRRAIDRFERSYIENLLRRTEGNVTTAARYAGVRRQHLQRLMARHGILSGRFTRPS